MITIPNDNNVMIQLAHIILIDFIHDILKHVFANGQWSQFPMLDNPPMSIHLLILIYLLIMMMMSHSESRGRSVTTTTRQSPRILAGARHKPNSTVDMRIFKNSCAMLLPVMECQSTVKHSSFNQDPN